MKARASGRPEPLAGAAPGPDEILDFWFGPKRETLEAIEARFDSWFSVDPGLDQTIRSRFGSLPDDALTGRLDEWLEDPPSTVALLIVLDQFPRNLYRGSARAFEYDARALEIALDWIEAGRDRFGRFPHRNDGLGRKPTPDELAYLEGGGATFGG